MSVSDKDLPLYKPANHLQMVLDLLRKIHKSKQPMTNNGMKNVTKLFNNQRVEVIMMQYFLYRR